MPQCKVCGEEVDELTVVKTEGRKKKVCEDCAQDVEHAEAIAQESEAVIQNMMGFKGRR